MSRTLFPGERELIASGHYEVHLRVEIRDSDGTWRNLSALPIPDGSGETLDWVAGLTLTASLEAPMMSGTLTLHRELVRGDDVLSLSPFIAASGLNRTAAGQYAPLLFIGRRIRASVACVEPGAAPESVSACMRPIVEGVLDEVDLTRSPAVCTFYDLGILLQRAQIKTPLVLGANDGSVVAEQVIQAMLDASLGSGSVTLYTPVPSDFAIRAYTQSPGPLLDAGKTVVLQRGGDVRYAYDASDQFRLTFSVPNREQTAADFMLPPSEYLDVTQFKVALGDIRTEVEVPFINAATGLLDQVTKPDAGIVTGPIADYGHLFTRLPLDQTNQIDTPEEATALAEFFLADMSTPAISHAVECLATPFVSLGDVIAFPDNGVHYDAPQTLAVVGWTHSFANGGGRTTLQCSGQPRGPVLQYLTRDGAQTGVPLGGPAPTFGQPYPEGSSLGGAGPAGAWCPITWDAESVEVFLHVASNATYPAPAPDISSPATAARRIVRLVGDIPQAPTWPTLAFVAAGTPGHALTITAYSRNAAGRLSVPSTFYLTASDPAGAVQPGTIASLTVEVRGDARVLTITRGTVTAGGAATNVVIRRNGTPIGYPSITALASGATLVWTDAGVDPGQVADYDVIPWCLGTTGPLVGVAATAPPDTPPTTPPADPGGTGTPPAPTPGVAPVFAAGAEGPTPYFEATSGAVRIAWTCADTASARVVVQKTYQTNGTGYFDVDSGPVASGSILDPGASLSGYYRLVAQTVSGGVRAVSAAKRYTKPTTGGGGPV